MTDAIIVALISLVGTALGAWSGVRAANKLTVYRIEQLEKKMDKHNNLIERMCTIEGKVQAIEDRCVGE